MSEDTPKHGMGDPECGTGDVENGTFTVANDEISEVPRR